MLLYVNTDTLKSTGWEGYDLLVNSNPTDITQTSAKKFEIENWIGDQKISYSYSGNELEIAVPIALFKLRNNQLTFSFHWVDNSQKLLDINEFFINGESAPDRRFDYLFSVENVTSAAKSTNNQLKFYPNPAKNKVKLQWPVQGRNLVMISIFNLTGIQLYSELISEQDGSKIIDLKGYPNGLFEIQVLSDSNRMKGKLVVVN